MKKLVFILLFTFSTTFVIASTVGETEYTCPLCGTIFKYFVQHSYSIFGRNLDMRPWGAAIIPTPIPKCPDCKFVFNINIFTENEIETLKTNLQANNIFENEPNMPNYYYLAREYEILNKKLSDIIWVFLSSVWENRNEDRRIFLINVTVDYINKLFRTDESFNNYQMIKLDLLRRSGQFAEANSLIEIIKQDKNLYKDFIVKVIDLQIELIGNRNQEEHRMPPNR
jgi:phage FluMu protein Com